MSELTNVTSITAARVPVPNPLPRVKASERIEQLRDALHELHDDRAWLEPRIEEAREAVHDLEVELCDLESRHENIEAAIRAMTEALDAAEHLAEVMGDLT